MIASEAMPGSSRLAQVLGRMVARPSGALGLLLIALHLLLALLSPWLATHDFKAVSATLILAPPDAQHWFGTDHLGRDVFSRTILGGREALMVTLVATPLAVAWGAGLGIHLGLVGGRIDDVLMRLVDAVLSLPWILKMLLLIVTFGTGLMVLIPTLAFFYGIPVIRIARAATHNVVARDFVAAAQARGHGRWSIMHRELMPNVLDALMVEAAMRWSWMLLAFSSLSFLGFGVSPPTPDWGLMIADARSYLPIAPWAGLFPIAALSTLIIGINLSTDALAKAMGVDRMNKAPV